MSYIRPSRQPAQASVYGQLLCCQFIDLRHGLSCSIITAVFHLHLGEFVLTNICCLLLIMSLIGISIACIISGYILCDN